MGGGGGGGEYSDGAGFLHMAKSPVCKGKHGGFFFLDIFMRVINYPLFLDELYCNAIYVMNIPILFGTVCVFL